MGLPILVSAILFSLSFPNILFLKGFSFLAWIFAIPLFWIFEQRKLFARLQAGFLFGLLANFAAVNWMIPYSFAGYVLLCIALSSQAVIFSALYPSEKMNKFLKVFYVSCAWVVSEFLRKILMFGQSWDLGHSQSFDIYFLQIAGFLGSFGISFLLICVNYLLHLLLFRLKRLSLKIVSLGAVIFLVTLVYNYGFLICVQRKPAPKAVFRICVVQPNIDYHGEISLERVEEIAENIIVLTRQALKNSKPDLVVWPETAVPMDFLDDDLLRIKISAFVQESGVPFLIGATIADGQGMHNSAVFLDENGIVQKIYHKRHLIPLTEYIPSTIFWKTFAKVFHIQSPRLVPGASSDLMEITSRTSGQKARFGVAICSEDNIADVFRQYAKDGADFVVVLLNNGWFSQKAGLLMHAEHSIIHAVENRIPTVRVANTGLSGAIDSLGRLSAGSTIGLQQRKFFHLEVEVLDPQKRNKNLMKIPKRNLRN